MPDQYGNLIPGDPGYVPPKDGIGAPIGRDPSLGPGDTATAGAGFDRFIQNQGKVLSGQQQSGTGHGFENAHAAVNHWLGQNKDALMGVYHPTQVQVGGQGQYAQTASPITANTSNAPNGMQQDEGRSMQMALIQRLQDQANGVGPSLAQMQLQKGTDQNMANAMALGQSQRGAGQAGMLKGIQGQQAGIAQGMAGDAAMLRLNEQMGANAQLGSQLGGMRGQDQGWAGMGMQNNQFNASQGNQNNQFYAGQQNNMANSNAQRQADAAKQQAELELQRQKMEQEAAKQGSPLGAIGGVLSAVSDERLKTDIAPGEAKLYAFLDKLGAHDYKYKDPKHGEGRRISPMAQELEQTDEGKAFVFEMKGGKAVDYGKGFGTMLASQAALHKRLKKLEGN